ncbi:methionine aminopeptidase 1 [Endogone sp. FLAS-F59071]|nr:methionine aminopeptidase 1 [Endogone sp. FLAS-F59071]|eukprot:RUS21642.1 methionine aminopeptidase 1 [Endogone sp. FLAS-F59071]
MPAISTMSVVTDQVCGAVDCENPAKLQCPTCIKLHIEGSFFCSQDCFKKSWGVHKAVHKASVAGDSTETYDPFKTFKYTGKLRAFYPLSPKREVPESIAWPDYAEAGIPLSEQSMKSASRIQVLSSEEIEGMRRACKISREVLDIGAAAIRVGITTDEIGKCVTLVSYFTLALLTRFTRAFSDRIVHEATIERGAYPSTLNYKYFPKSCCTSVNEVICHGIPDKRPLEDGDIVNLDIACYFGGFHGDVNATYLVGNVDEAGMRLVNNSRMCLEKAIATIKPGMLFRDIGKVIEAHARSENFSVVRSFCGHGINSLFHCTPNVPHYAKNKAVGVCKPGVTFTIEPMICEGSWRDELWPDDWTIVTADGKRSAQFEHTLLVTETGVEILTGPAF